MFSSFHAKVPASLANSAPWNVFGCQTPIAAPSGSANTAMRPMSETSIGSTNTVAPAFLASSTVASASSTET